MAETLITIVIVLAALAATVFGVVAWAAIDLAKQIDDWSAR